ncbi:MAG: AAA family ATPase [Ruminococcus sp.]|nr:AAA family ATPase [Ruminococcus sp.]MCM1381651.1 AAA family ATPase [Muribaculaceae bacterium]MCM1478460.1 AAA family ATPase [Muribaculaceae bacterium]
MFDKSRLKDVLIKYKQDFVSANWKSEKYKWEAIKCFQDNWDIKSSDFADMLARSLSKTANLLASVNYFPARMITDFAKIAPEEVKSMFIALFDENDDIYERINAFKLKSQILLEKYGNGAGSHYQTENAISTYLWLRFPDKYYIYKFSEIKTVANELGNDYKFKKGAYADNIRNFYKFYDEICNELTRDMELIGLFKNQLTDTCYPDTKLKTLTIDVGFYISRYYNKWFPTDYEPKLTVDDWVRLLADSTVFTNESLEIMKRMKDYGGAATCTQLAEKYGENFNFYNSGSVALARRVAEKTSCPLMKREDGSPIWWTVLYIGRNANNDENGSYLWRLRDELSEALEKVDLNSINLCTNLDTYTKENFLEDVYMSKEKYENLTAVLKNKKNIILQGAPGVGKTFSAKRLAYSIMGEKDESRIEFVQFHQNYSYEDFVMGYRPTDDGFELKYGIFYRFCQKAASQPDKKYFFIIDEINRGNMSKIFGELLMLIERDYRDTEVALAYNGLPFSVPKNIYIIGMMNTADRSLAMIDYALRRRFSFLDVEPGFDSEGFIRYQNNLNNDAFNELIANIKELNKEIVLDKSLGKGFCIGHSYFCNCVSCTDEWLRSIVDYDILPTLREYWFDNANELQRWENILHGIFQ